MDYKKAGERDRTPDLRITNALLYQLSYASKILYPEVILDRRHFILDFYYNVKKDDVEFF